MSNLNSGSEILAKSCLLAIAEALNVWRSHRRPPHVPHELREQMVALLDYYSVAEIVRTLRINHQMLKQWRRQFAAAEPSGGEANPAFIALPPAVAVEPASAVLPALTITHHRGSGQAVSLQGQLNVAQWRQALSLLAQAQVTS